MDSVFENVDHNKSFPAKIFVTQVSRCAFHWHYDYEIILILKGSVTVYCGSEPITLKAGDLFLFNTMVVHGIQRTGDDNLVLCLQFSPQILENNLKIEQFYHYFYLNSSSPLYPPDRPYAYFIVQMVKLMLANQAQHNASSIRTYSLLLAYIADLVDHVQYDIRRSALTQSEDTSNEFCNNILAYIEQNLTAPNLAQTMCRNFGMSEKSLYRYLKNTLGLSFKELYDIIRVEKACTMLHETKKSIAIVWESCGFSSEVSFYRNFKKQMGVTPKEYRNGINTQSEETFSGDSYGAFNLGEATALLYRFLDTYSQPERGNDHVRG